MSSAREQAALATGRLREVVLTLAPGQKPLGLPPDVWTDLGGVCIANWVDDLTRTCDRVARALELADKLGREDETLEAVEGALWRLDAAREKLAAVFALAFGLPSLERYREGYRFAPDTKAIRAKLKELAGGSQAAGELGRLGSELAEHEAVQLRNQLSHQLAPIEAAREVCWIDLAHLRKRSIVSWTGSPLYVEGLLDEGDISARALWNRVLRAIRECFALLVRTIEVLADVLDELAVLEPPQRVYKDEDSGGLSLTDPR